MNAQQRAEIFDGYKAKVNETDAERRDRAMALASERGQVIAELVQALTAASHALRSYQYGNASQELAASIADRCDAAIKRGESA